MTRMTIGDWPRSKEHLDRAVTALGAGVSSGMRAQFKPQPLFFERGNGAHVTDVDGNDYIDYVLGWGPVITGHAHPHVVRRVTEQAARGQAFGAATVAEYTLAERVADAMPGVERVLWGNTGTEANLLALRLARACTGRNRFVKFLGHYHGWSDHMLVGYRPGIDGSLPSPGSRGQDPGTAGQAVLVDWNDLDGVRRALSAPDSDIAAVFCEPVLCNSGVIMPEPGFLEGLRRVCDEAGCLLIFDEVITGFRISYGGGTQRFGVTPDLVVLGKAIASGFPLAAVAGRAQIIDEVTRGVRHAGTYNGNGMVIAAAHATLDLLSEPGTHDRLDATTRMLAAGLGDATRRAGVPADVHAVTGVVQVSLTDEPTSTLTRYQRSDWGLYERLGVELLRRGVYVLPGGRWYVSTAHTTEDIEVTAHAFATALAAL